MAQTFREPRQQALSGSFRDSILAFVDQMQLQGYAATSLETSTRLAMDFVVWLDQHQITPDSLAVTHAGEYLDERWLLRRRHRGDAFALREFTRLALPDIRKVILNQESGLSSACQVLQEFKHYLLHERGLAKATIRLYIEPIERFLQNVFGDLDIKLDQLKAQDIIRFVEAEAARLSHPKRAKVMTTALRSFLQYGRYRGYIVLDLRSCVPTVASWSMTGIPKAIAPSQVQRLLNSCDRQSATGR